MLTCLYTSDTGGLTASELVQRLQVSPASISKAITHLESQDLVRRERDERRRERYIVDNDVWYQAMIASARSNAQLAETARQGIAILGPGTPAAARLENIARSSTSSARTSPAPRSRPARSCTPKPKRSCPSGVPDARGKLQAHFPMTRREARCPTAAALTIRVRRVCCRCVKRRPRRWLAWPLQLDWSALARSGQLDAFGAPSPPESEVRQRPDPGGVDEYRRYDPYPLRAADLAWPDGA